MSSTPLTRTAYNTSFGDNAAANYQKYFVPVIGGPSRSIWSTRQDSAPGERVLDVACGTGAIARLARSALRRAALSPHSTSTPPC
jgi:2-polyprenyl-3-methyl-5-hydroxy-6-metoxy-1,4-benzoquinol methylase